MSGTHSSKSSPVASSPVTSSPVASSPVTSSPVTSSGILSDAPQAPPLPAPLLPWRRLGHSSLVSSSALLGLCALASLLLLLGAAPCSAGPAKRELAEQLHPSASQRVDEHEADFGLDLRLRLQLPSYREADEQPDLLSSVALSASIPGSVVIDYEGLQGFVVKRARRRYRKLWRNQFKDWVRETYISDWELNRRAVAMGDAYADMLAGGRWWDRRWFHSLPEAKGGAPDTPYVHQVGQRTCFLRLGPLELYNDMRARLDKVAVLGLDPDPDRIYRPLRDVPRQMRDHAALGRVDGDVPAALADEDELLAQRPAVAILSPPPLAATLEFSSKVQARYERYHFDFKVRPEVRVRLRSNQQLDGRIGARASMDVYYGARRDHVIEVEARVRFRPLTREVQATIQVALLSW